jgi:NADH:ubiquinone oxidoreductase subunit F (NADH-binding)/NADH:ubiquinone oxidoreductase subunit E
MSDTSAPSGPGRTDPAQSRDRAFKRGSGGGRRGGRPFPKGRQIDPQALEEVRKTLGNRPRRADLLIEHLHLFQDRFGHISASHLAGLAHEMRMAMAEVYEVASFYAHFDVVREGETPPPAITIRVCDSLTCEMFGAEKLLAEIAVETGNDIRAVRAPCMGACDKAPVVAVGHTLVEQANKGKAVAAGRAALAGKPEHRHIDPVCLDDYLAGGGYGLLRACLSGKRSAEEVLESLGESALRGLGGAGFPTPRKWSLVRAVEGRKALAVNADEGEPGTFKDRYYLERDPHRTLEGMLIAAWLVGAEDCYFYLRDEYPEIRALLDLEIAGLEAEGLVAHTRIHLRRGAGAYICGEESAMIESIEGKRGYPRHRPPYVAQVGLFGRPTLVNNVETLFWVRDIIEKGADWFNDQGKDGHSGFRSYSVSGRVKNPGVKVAPAGVTVRELIEDYCGGMLDGHAFHAYLPGGASGGILPASMGNLLLDFGELEKYGCFVGSHAVVVLSDQDSVKAAALNLLRFFEDESCGQCSPCRVGTEKAVKLMRQEKWDTGLLDELSATMRDASICGLGQAASNPLASVMKFFPDEV